MIQSLPEEHSHAMMLKHSTTKHLLPPLSQHSAMGPLFIFQGRGGGTQVCRSRRETDSWAGDLMYKITQFIQLLKLHLQNCNVNDVPRRFLLKVTSSLCEREQTSSTSSIQDHRYETDLEGKTQVMLLMERQMCSVRFLLGQGMWSTWQPCTSGLREVTSPVCHLPDTAPLQANNIPSWSWQQSSHDCLPAQYLFFILLPLTDSRSWLLYVSPTWLTPLALVGSPPDSVKVSWSSLPCSPTWWYLTPLPGYHGPLCAVSSVWIIRLCQWAILPFVAHGDTFLTFIHAPPTSWSSFIKAWPFTCFSYSIFHTPDLSDLSVFVAISYFQKKEARVYW